MILSPVIRQRYFDANGNPLAGGKLYSYVANTTTPQATYTDQGGGTANANPVILDPNGEANVWVDPSLAYKFRLDDSTDVTQWTVDQVSGSGDVGIGGWNANSNYSQGNIVADASGSGLLYVSLQSNNVGNALTSVAYWRIFGGGTRTLTSSTSLAITDEIVRSNSTGGGIMHTLPACSTTPIGKRITVKDVGTGGNTTSVKGAGTDQVDGAVTYSNALRANESATFCNNGSSWNVIWASYIIQDASVTQIKLAARASGTSVAAGGVAISTSSSSFSTSSSSIADVTNLAVTITTTGRPVFVGLQADGSGVGGLRLAGASTPGNGTAGIITIVRGSTTISTNHVEVTSNTNVNFLDSSFPPGSVRMIDVIAAGTYTYKVQAALDSGQFGSLSVANCVLVAYEL